MDTDNTFALVKCADDSSIVAPVWKDHDISGDLVKQFLNWSDRNHMICNPDKCKELVFSTSNNVNNYPSISGIPLCNKLLLLGVTFQSDCKFSTHVKNKLTKANRCLFILRLLRKEGYNQEEIVFLLV